MKSIVYKRFHAHVKIVSMKYVSDALRDMLNVQWRHRFLEENSNVHSEKRINNILGNTEKS